MKKTGLLLIAILLVNLLFSGIALGSEDNQLTKINIGLIYDGTDAFNQKLKRSIETEIQNVLAANYQINFIETKGNNPTELKQQLEQMLKNERVDVVITGGVLSSHLAVKKKQFNKPVIAPYLLDKKFLNFKINEDQSGIKNLNFVTCKEFLNRDIASFEELADFKTLTFLVNEEHNRLLFQNQPELKEEVLGSNIEIETISTEDSVFNIIDRLKETEAVYLSPLLTISNDKLAEIATELKKREIPTLTAVIDNFNNQNDLLAAYSHSEELKRRARTAAINLESFLLQKKLSKQPVYISKSESSKRHLIIDLTVAETIDQLPDWEMLKQIKIINDPRDQGREVTLQDAIQISINDNLDLNAENQSQKIAQSKLKQAENNRKPLINFDTTYSQVEEDIAANSMGLVKEKTWTGDLKVKQVLFNEQINANIDIKNKLQQQSEAEFKEKRLDTILATMTSYYNTLRMKSDVELQQKNLSLTKENLEIAKTKHQVGDTGLTDIYRWESELAMNSSDLTQAKQNFNTVKDNLKRMLNLELDQNINITDVEVQPVIAEIKDRFNINTPWGLEKVITHLVKRGIKNSVELQQLDYLIQAKEREYKMLKRDRYLPEVGLQAGYKKYFDESGAGTGIEIPGIGSLGESTDGWSVGLQASFSIYEGGNQKEELDQIAAEIKQLKTKRESTVEKLSQNIRTKINNVNTQYLKFKDAQAAVTAADNNLELVRDAYSKGTVAVSQLLDAQSALISAERKKSVTKYDFLIAVAEAKRALGKYEF